MWYSFRGMDINRVRVRRKRVRRGVVRKGGRRGGLVSGIFLWGEGFRLLWKLWSWDFRK